MARRRGGRGREQETELQCFNPECGNRFKAPVPVVPIDTANRGIVDWVPKPTGKERCPRCGSGRIGVPSGPRR